jgi:cytochrome P450
MTATEHPPHATTNYDHYVEDFALDPHPTWARLRRECPVSYTPNYGGFFVASRLQDIQEVVQDPETFSSFPADTPPDPRHSTRLIPMEVDPPEHRRYRRAFEPLFRPKVIGTLTDSLRTDARSLVNHLLELRTFDFIEEFAAPFPSSAFLKLLGLPNDRDTERTLAVWVNQILHAEGADPADPADQTRVRAGAGRELKRFLDSAIARTREERRDGLILSLLDPEFTEQHALSDAEMHNFLHVLVLGGLETVTTALGFSFLHLGRRPDLQEKLASDPALIPSAVEELLRYESSVHPTRTVTQSCTLGGVALRPGDRIALPYGSANRDEAVFERPDEILFDRRGNRHLAFGGGNHRCLGSHLARLEMRIAFEEIFRAIPRFCVPEDFRPRAAGGQTRSIGNLPFQIL